MLLSTYGYHQFNYNLTHVVGVKSLRFQLGYSGFAVVKLRLLILTCSLMKAWS